MDKKRTKQDSMLNLLRQDLQKIPCLHSIGRHSISLHPGLEDDIHDLDGSLSPLRQWLSRKHSATSPPGGMHSRQSSISQESGPPVLTDHELRKLQMLHTLNKMGSYVSRKSVYSDYGEKAVLESSYSTVKRGSISTRVLLAAQRRSKRSKAAKEELEKATKVQSPPSTSEKSKDERPILQHANTEDLFDDPRSDNALGITVGEPDNANQLTLSTPEAKTKRVSIAPITRPRVRRIKGKPIRRFRKLAKFLVILFRTWKIHSNAINDMLVLNNDSLDMMTHGNDPDLLFDVTSFKAVKEAKLSQEARRILQKKPYCRTDEEEYHVQVALRNYRTLAEYPVKMQRMIAQRSWFESYDAKRVIVREGHVPMCFYFVLSGSAIVSTTEDGRSRTMMFLSRGDSFGDIAILNRSRRETTVISREKIELLCMADTDFIDIFMSGGLTDPNDPFLNSIHFLQGWPKEKLIENPKKCIFSFFKFARVNVNDMTNSSSMCMMMNTCDDERGTILVHDSKKSDWIFVVKSGSASILKKLRSVDVDKPRRVKKRMDFREEVVDLVKCEGQLSHEEHIQMMYEEEIRSLDDQNLMTRVYALPDINVRTNDAYNELKQLREEYTNTNTMARALGSLEKMVESGEVPASEVRSEVGTDSVATLATPSPSAFNGKHRRMSLAALSSMLSKRPFLLQSGKGQRKSVQLNPDDNNNNVEKHVHTNQMVDDWQGTSLLSVPETAVELNIKHREFKPVFVEVQTLTKGQIFGMSDIIFEHQPSLSLVSNGAECVMIEKKLFLEHVTMPVMINIREMTYPYPSEDALQENLESYYRWNIYKKDTFNEYIQEVRLKKTNIHDSRTQRDLLQPIFLK